MIGQYDGITSSESFSLTIPSDYDKQLHYYCTRTFHTSMVDSLNIVNPPAYLNSNRLIITEVDRSTNYVEVTNFGEERYP